MSLRTVASFSLEYLQILNEQGELVGERPAGLNSERLLKLYKMMVLMREIDRKCVNLQRQGRIGTYAPTEGQEACQVGSAVLLHKDDWVFPAFREQGVFLTRGLPLSGQLLYFMGSEVSNQIPEGNNTFPVVVPVASQLPLAVGCAMAKKIKREPGVAVTYFGDGATSEGDFNEALNFASVYQAPVIFICQNNQWAISVPRTKQTRAQTLAQKGIAYEMSSLQVDGNDLFAVYQATGDALQRARTGMGPSFLELVTYRMRMHTTADDPTKYRSEEEVKAWAGRDPILRLERYLKKERIIDDAFTEGIREEAELQLKAAYAEAENVIKQQRIEDIFIHTYSELPENLKEQLEEAKSHDQTTG